MSRSVEVQGQHGAWVPSAADVMERSAWQAWLAKGRARDQQGNAKRVQALKWFLTAVLLAAAGFWVQPAPYDIVFRFIVAAGAVTLMAQAFRARSYTFTALFGVVMWLYNPIAPVFSLSGDWQRVLVSATTIPLILSLVWDKPRQAQK